MKTLETLENNKEEIICQTLDLLPNAMRGDRVNRTFFVKEENDKIIVDYFVYCGQTNLSDNSFFTIKDTESFDAEDYGVTDFDEIDFLALGWDEKIREAIERKIEDLE